MDAPVTSKPGQAFFTVWYFSSLPSSPIRCLIAICTQSPAEARITELQAKIARLSFKRPSVTSPINTRLQPFRTAAPTIPTRELSPTPRIAHLDHLFAHFSRAAPFLAQEPCSTQPHTFELRRSRFWSPCPARFIFCSVQDFASASDITILARPELVRGPSTRSALCYL